MSFCRWSCDNFHCDVYAYESADGLVIHVANRRLKPGAVLEPDPFNPIGESLEPIAAPSAGKSFCEPTVDAYLERMLALRAEGIKFPDYAIDWAKEEIAERDNAN